MSVWWIVGTTLQWTGLSKAPRTLDFAYRLWNIPLLALRYNVEMYTHIATKK